MSVSIVLILSPKLLYQKQPLECLSFLHVFYSTSSWIYKEIIFHCILHFLGSEWPLLPFCLQSGFRRSNLLKICSFCACILLYKQLDNTHKEFLSHHISQFLGLEYPTVPNLFTNLQWQKQPFENLWLLCIYSTLQAGEHTFTRILCFITCSKF